MPVIPVQIPSGGLNTSSALSAMPPNDAVQLVNAVVRDGYIEALPGADSYITSRTYQHSLIPFIGKSSKVLVLGDSTGLYDITNPASITTLGTGFSGDPWQWTHFQDKIILTGGGTAQTFDGTTLTALNVTSGPAANTLWGCFTFKGRAYYWQKNSQKFIYATAGAYQGTLTEFDLGGLITKGGFIVTMDSITMDGGAGVDDLAVFVFSTGEALVYQGDDPGSASNWQLVGRYEMPEPLSIRGKCKIGAETIVMTKNGYYPLSQVMSGQYAALSQKIDGTIKSQVSSYNTQDASNNQSFCFGSPRTGIAFFFHVEKSGSVSSTRDGANASYQCFNTSNQTWSQGVFYNSAGSNSANYLRYIRCACEFDGAIYFAVRYKGAPTNLIEAVYKMEPDTLPSFPVVMQTAFSSPGSSFQATAIKLLSNIPPTENHRTYILTDYETLALNPFISSLTSSSGVSESWKNITGYGRALSVLFLCGFSSSYPARVYEFRVRAKQADER